MNDRTSQILEAAIQEFIDTGEPVSSGWLYEKYDFGIKPAMIRLELDTLEENGYLEKPHHAAGRVPTNAGYEFFVKGMLEKSIPGTRQAPRALTRRRSVPELLNELSQELGLLGVAAD